MSQKPDITDLTICRAAFAAWVFVYHVDLYLNFSAFLGPFAGVIRHGYMGVDGFFILSGLILMHTHREFDVKAMDTPKAKFALPGLASSLRFYGKRLARIYPVHLAALLILLALSFAGDAAGMTAHAVQRFGLDSFIQNLLLVQGWGGDHFGAWNYPSWSVSAEWAGYLLFPLFAVILTYFNNYVSLQVAIIIFPILGFIYVYSGHSLNLTFGSGLLRFFPEFIAGMAAYRVATPVADSNAWRGFFLWGGTSLTVLGAVLGVDLVTVIGLWALIFAFYLQADAQLPPILGRRPMLRFLGLLSYCFYMSFAIAELVTVRAFAHFNIAPKDEKFIFAASMTLLTFILAFLLRGFVEQPCRRAAERWLAPPSPPDDKKKQAVTEIPQSLF